MTDKPIYTVDVRGTITPFSLLKVSLVFQQMKPREVLEIWGCDSEMQLDLARILPDAAWEPLLNEEKQIASETTIVRVKKKR